MASLATERDDPALSLAAMIAQCIIHATYNPVYAPHKARELGEAALTLALKLKDREAEARVLWCLMMVEFHSGSLGQHVLDYGEKALFMARELGMKELEGYVLGNLSWAYTHRLQLREALQANAQALKIWQALGNLPMVSDAYAIKMGNLRMTGEYEDLLTTGVEAIHLGQAIGNPLHHYMALLMMGETYGVKGRLGQAFLHFEQAATVAEVSGDDRLSWGHHLYRINAHLLCGDMVQAEQVADHIYASLGESARIFQEFVLASITMTKIALGKLREAEATLEQAFTTLDRDVSFSFAIVPLLVADGHLQLILGNSERVLDRTADVARKLKQAGGRFYLAELLWLQGKAYLGLEQVEQAKAVLMEAKKVAEYTGERTILWQILATLSDLEMNSGNQSEAEMLNSQAREIITFIADHIGSESLRDSFLTQPAVEQVMMKSKVRIRGYLA
jgi:tetratricopeptide (TPR) repeat protein